MWVQFPPGTPEVGSHSGLVRLFRKQLSFTGPEVRILLPPPSSAETLVKAERVSSDYGGRRPLNMYYVYILKCSDGKTYVGCTDNLDDRLKRHNSGWVPATKSRLPIELITYIVFQDKYKAYNFEKYLKSGSGRAFLNKRLV